jgi:hypothetical protein
MSCGHDIRLSVIVLGKSMNHFFYLFTLVGLFAAELHSCKVDSTTLLETHLQFPLITFLRLVI